MSENATPPHDPLSESGIGAAPASSPTAAPVPGEPAPISATPPALALPSALPAEAHAMLELVGRGLAPDADEATRRAARDLWARFAQVITAPGAGPPAGSAMPIVPAAHVTSTMAGVLGVPTAPMMPAAAAMPAAPVLPVAPMPTTPIAIAAQALRQMPPDQLLELLLQRLRSALPTGATVPIPKAIQFPLVPVPPPTTGSR